MRPHCILTLTPTNVALILLFACTSFHCLAKYFYSSYSLIFGILYPCYSSFKAIKKKDPREYTKWLMYWVCFGFFSSFEFFSDILLGFWFPFYYELKILFVLWLVSPFGNGARILYKSVVHPEINKREKLIDSNINKATEYGVHALLELWSKFTELINKGLNHCISYAYNSLNNHLQNASFQQITYNANFFNTNAIESENSNQMVRFRTNSIQKSFDIDDLESDVDFLITEEIETNCNDIGINKADVICEYDNYTLETENESTSRTRSKENSKTDEVKLRRSKRNASRGRTKNILT